jgi:hypothetical protein
VSSLLELAWEALPLHWFYIALDTMCPYSNVVSSLERLVQALTSPLQVKSSKISTWY